MNSPARANAPFSRSALRIEPPGPRNRAGMERAGTARAGKLALLPLNIEPRGAQAGGAQAGASLAGASLTGASFGFGRGAARDPARPVAQAPRAQNPRI